METFLSPDEARTLLGISARELDSRLESGVYRARDFPHPRLAGRTVRRVMLESLPGDRQLAYWESCPQKRLGSGDVDTMPPKAAIEQLDLPLDDGEAWRYLPPALRQYAMKWFDVLAPNDLLHWNGLWKSRFYNRVFTVNHAGELPRQFTINSKTALMEYLAAVHHIPVRTLYTRRQEILDYFTYLGECRRAGRAPDAATLAAFFPARAKDAAGTFKRRADKGQSKSITPAVQQWLLARFAQGSEPGKGGWRPNFVSIQRELETLRDFLELQGDAESAGLTVPSLSAVRRFYRAHRSDPAIIWSQDGSKKFAQQVVPFSPRSYDIFTHDWWVSDHRLSNLWVWLDEDPEIPPFRPWVTWWMDVRSRWPVAFVGALVPSSVTIMRAWKEAVLRHQMAPLHAYTDNGKDYLAVVLNGSGARSTPCEADPRFRSNDGLDEKQKGMIERFGSKVHHALPSSRDGKTGEVRCHAQSKVIERFFQNLDPFDHSLRGACGEGPTDKPEKLAAELHLHAEAVEKWKAAGAGTREAGSAKRFESPTLMALSEYIALLENFLVTGYGQRVHRGEGMDCSPLEAFTRYSPERFGIIRAHITSADIAALMLMPPKQATVRNLMIDVEVSGHTEYYQHADFYWMTGQRVTVELDPSDPSQAWVSQDGRFIGRAQRVGKLAYGAPAAVIGAREKLKRYVVHATKDRVKQLAAATFIPTQEQLAAMRAAVAESRGPAGDAGIPCAISLDRGRQIEEAEQRRQASAAAPEPPVDAQRFVAEAVSADEVAPSLYQIAECTVEEG